MGSLVGSLAAFRLRNATAGGVDRGPKREPGCGPVLAALRRDRTIRIP
jgi:hypothetical protein